MLMMAKRVIGVIRMNAYYGLRKQLSFLVLFAVFANTRVSQIS